MAESETMDSARLSYEQQYDMILRVIVVGDSTVGKSSLIQAFASNLSPDNKYYQEPTIGVDFYSKLVFVRPNLCVKLQIWDTAGQEKFRCLTSAYYRNSVGALLLYDMTQRSSFENLQTWYDEVRRNIGYSSGVVQLVACKSDLEDERTVSREEGQQFASERGLGFFESSAVSKHNVDQLFEQVATQICLKLERAEIVFDQNCDGIRLTNSSTSRLWHVQGLRQLYLATESLEDRSFDRPDTKSQGYSWFRFGRRRVTETASTVPAALTIPNTLAFGANNASIRRATYDSDFTNGDQIAQSDDWYLYRGCC